MEMLKTKITILKEKCQCKACLQTTNYADFISKSFNFK